VSQIISQAVPLWVLQHLPVMVFIFAFGACVGSFINVIIYRLPAGLGIIHPPSRCPQCFSRLRFFRENLPILGWFLLRGRCRYCNARISAQYMIVEILMAIVFLATYVLLYGVHPGTWWLGGIGGSWWYSNTVFETAPVFIAVVFLLAGLIAATVIDARTFMIPIQIPLFLTITAFMAYPVQVYWPHRNPTAQTWPIPCIGWAGCGAAIVGMIGVVIGVLLLRRGVLRYSFADYYDYVDEHEVIGDYPHARREMIVEIAFLLPTIAGIVLGYFLGRLMLPGVPPEVVQAIGATFMGYLVGAGIVWAARIIFTFAFDKEAMGIGDVHLLGAIGAVVGWVDPILIFFIAPFSGLLWAAASFGLSAMFKTSRRELPYGPHLAAATLIVLLARPGIEQAWRWYMPGVPLPTAGFVQPANPDGAGAAAQRGRSP